MPTLKGTEVSLSYVQKFLCNLLVILPLQMNFKLLATYESSYRCYTLDILFKNTSDKHPRFRMTCCKDKISVFHKYKLFAHGHFSLQRKCYIGGYSRLSV